MSRFEEVVMGSLLVFFIALLSLIALADGIWLLWIAVALLVGAFLSHVGIG